MLRNIYWFAVDDIRFFTYDQKIMSSGPGRVAKGKGKGPNIALKERTPHRATERHLSHGITQCCLPFDRGENAPRLNPS